MVGLLHRAMCRVELIQLIWGFIFRSTLNYVIPVVVTYKENTLDLVKNYAHNLVSIPVCVCVCVCMCVCVCVCVCMCVCVCVCVCDAVLVWVAVARTCL